MQLFARFTFIYNHGYQIFLRIDEHHFIVLRAWKKLNVPTYLQCTLANCVYSSFIQSSSMNSLRVSLLNHLLHYQHGTFLNINVLDGGVLCVYTTFCTVVNVQTNIMLVSRRAWYIQYIQRSVNCIQYIKEITHPLLHFRLNYPHPNT